MKPFKPTKHQLESIKSGATKLWVPLTNQLVTLCLSDPLEKDLSMFKAFIVKYSPLQPNEQYFVQEDYFNIDKSRCSCIMTQALKYASDYDFSNSIFENEQLIESQHMDWYQSRFKFTVTNVEVKQVQDLSLHDIIAVGLNINDRYPDGLPKAFGRWYDSQYPNQPYSTNPTGFLVSIKYL